MVPYKYMRILMYITNVPKYVANLCMNLPCNLLTVCDFTYFSASGHLNGDICLWNAETSKLITKLISHRSGMNCLNFILPIVPDF